MHWRENGRAHGLILRFTRGELENVEDGPKTAHSSVLDAAIVVVEATFVVCIPPEGRVGKRPLCRKSLWTRINSFIILGGILKSNLTNTLAVPKRLDRLSCRLRLRTVRLLLEMARTKSRLVRVGKSAIVMLRPVRLTRRRKSRRRLIIRLTSPVLLTPTPLKNRLRNQMGTQTPLVGTWIRRKRRIVLRMKSMRRPVSTVTPWKMRHCLLIVSR